MNLNAKSESNNAFSGDKDNKCIEKCISKIAYVNGSLKEKELVK
jgi:hypothetical protein